MKKHILQLAQMAERPSRTIIGLMSGTSFDGLDVALCTISGNGMSTEVIVNRFETIPYDNSFREKLKKVFSKKDAWLEDVCMLNPFIAAKHAQIIIDCLGRWKISKENVDLVASHGQTIFHAPKSLHKNEEYGNATLQIGDGDHLAVLTGIITVSDFRQKHIAAGGEGAPLAVYGDYFLFSSENECRIMLNIGGISNFTFLPAGKNARGVFSSDIGPGNTLMDAVVRKHFPGQHYDRNGIFAGNGKVNNLLLEALKSHQFFAAGFPKTTGPELFNLEYLLAAVDKTTNQHMTPEDILATLNMLTAETIAGAIKSCMTNAVKCVVYSSGGGMHNPVLMHNVRELLPGVSILTTETLKINPDAKEAVLFAILANECVAGGELSLGQNNTKIPSVSMGKISFPA